MKTMKNAEKGFTLIEVMVSSLIVLTVAAVSMQLLLTPKDKVLELEMRSEVSRYLNNKLEALKEMPSFPTTGNASADETHYCSPSGSCNAAICGDVCNQYNSKCNGYADDGNLLADMIARNKAMCFVHVKMNIDCAGEDNDQATQVCIKAEWPKKGSGFYEEALTAFLVK